MPCGIRDTALTKEMQLMAMLEVCRGLEADIRHHPQHNYFTVMVWKGWDHPDPKHIAENVQARIKVLAEQYPDIVCYCFDRFSTLIYVV